MDTCEIKLKCLELAHRSDLPPLEIISRAKLYEQYINPQAGSKEPKTRQATPKP
jgi:hypothetical protein